METSGLSAAQPLLVLVVGLPGSGKSFFARQFSENYKFFYIDTGRYESELETLGSSSEEISTVVAKLVNATFEQALKSFKHIVLEGPFNSERQRADVLSKAKKAGFGTLVVWVQTDEETAEYRALNRDRRRADDKFSVQLSDGQFLKIKKSFQRPDPKKGALVVISGKHNFTSQGVAVLKKIASMYVEGVNIPSSQSQPKTILR